MTWKTIGFAKEKKYFDRQITEDTLGHAYIFYGQERIGKRMFACELVARVAQAHDSSVISSHDIDAIRSLKKSLGMTTMGSEWKAVVIDDAHALSEEAQNALLKVLEEPTDRTLIILVTHQPSSLLATIRSRCQDIFFPAHSKKVFESYLAGQKLSQNQHDFLFAFSGGSIGLCAEDFKKIKTYAQEYMALASANLDSQFDTVKKLSEDELLLQKILYWMLYLRTKKMYKPLSGLLALHKTISQPQFNKQLALENFVLSL